MDYTIRISDTSPKARSIINLLKELAQDYPFLHIYEDYKEESAELMEDLECRYDEAMKNPEAGESWEQVKADLMSK